MKRDIEDTNDINHRYDFCDVIPCGNIERRQRRFLICIQHKYIREHVPGNKRRWITNDIRTKIANWVCGTKMPMVE